MKKILIIYSCLALLILSCGKVSPTRSQQPSEQQPDIPGPPSPQADIDGPKPAPSSPPRQPALGTGALKFGVIPQLSKDWWHSGADKAFEIWDKNTLYLWGANISNYLLDNPKLDLGGDGLAGSEGPSRGHGHPHYVGVITTSLSKAENDAVFKKLEKEQAQGKNIVVPISPEGRWALGTGLALGWFNNDARAWKQSQYYLLDHIHSLALGARQVDFGNNTFWPDCTTVTDCKTIGRESPRALKIKTTSDLDRVKNYALAMSKNELAGFRFRQDASVNMAPEQYYGLKEASAGTDIAFTAFTLVLVKNADGRYEVLTQARAASKAIEAPGGHLTGGQTWQEGAVDELEQEAGIALAKEALIYLTGGNNLSSRTPPDKNTNANFVVVFSEIKPRTSMTSHEIDTAYGHRWLDLKLVYKEISEEERRLGYKNDGKYYRFFRGMVNSFCTNVVKNLGVCE